MDENYGLPVKTYHIGKNTPVFGTYSFSTLFLFRGKGPVIYACMDAIWSTVRHIVVFQRCIDFIYLNVFDTTFCHNVILLEISLIFDTTFLR